MDKAINIIGASLRDLETVPAVRAAQAMRRKLVELNRGWAADAQAANKPFQPVHIGIGLNTGECCVGNFGSIHRFNYSVLGDHVNLASRLEGATKFYRATILASETTRRLSPELAWLEVDNVRALGKTQAVKVFALAGTGVESRSAGFSALADIHDRMPLILASDALC